MIQSNRVASQPRIQLLCGFELTVDERPVALTPASERLVAFLAMQARSVRRSFVSGSLWPDATSDRANANLRSAVWRVPVVDRRPLVDASPTHLGLRPGVYVDFHAAVPLATALMHAVEAEVTDDMLALLEGDLLPDWHEDWIVLERERHRQLRLHALDQACACMIRQGRYGEAMVMAMGAIAADPLRESGFRFAVEIHLAEGNLIEAVQQYRTYADRLRDELGVRPSRRLRSLLEPTGVPT
jgi:DNA-binding SARP family transcriptional activator